MPFMSQLQHTYENLSQPTLQLKEHNKRLGQWGDLIGAAGKEHKPPQFWKEKVPNLKKFLGTGGTEEFGSWMAFFLIKLSINDTWFSNEQHKLAYLYSRLQRSAK